MGFRGVEGDLTPPDWLTHMIPALATGPVRQTGKVEGSLYHLQELSPDNAQCQPSASLNFSMQKGEIQDTSLVTLKGKFNNAENWPRKYLHIPSSYLTSYVLEDLAHRGHLATLLSIIRIVPMPGRINKQPDYLLF